MKQICKFCKSEINSECYVCPICRQWLHPFRLKKDNPLIKLIIFSTIIFLSIIYIPRFIAGKYILNQFTVKQFQSAEIHRLKIVSHKVKKLKDRIVILGELKNEGIESFSSIEIEAVLLDKNKELVDIETGRVNGSVNPGETRAFEIVRCCEKDNINNGLSEFDSYKLKIVDGYLNTKKKE